MDSQWVKTLCEGEERGFHGGKKIKGKKPVSIRLADSRGRYGLPHYSSHDALVDALATAELFMAQIRHHFSPETPIGDLWL